MTMIVVHKITRKFVDGIDQLIINRIILFDKLKPLPSMWLFIVLINFQCQRSNPLMCLIDHVLMKNKSIQGVFCLATF